MRRINVELGSRSYPILIGSGLLLCEEKLLQSYIASEKVLIVTNETIAPLYLENITKNLQGKNYDVVILPDGERYKNLETVNLIFNVLLEKKHNRKSTLIALGGGVVGDMTGFAAACYQRGVRFVQIPTTLLAQVDSSVGGKTGVNHVLGKNMIGAFHQPNCVLIDVNTLSTLPDREYVSGLAEVIKYGLISDAGFFQWLEVNISSLVKRESLALERAIELSCINKAKIVSADELECGDRALLNFGHTFGHAIESWQEYEGCLHGEAVAIGMSIATALSCLMGFIAENEYLRIIRILEKSGLPVLVPSGMNNFNFMEFMGRDKKNTDGKINLILLSSLGAAFMCALASERQIFSAIDMRRL